jgi:NAD+ kinase
MTSTLGSTTQSPQPRQIRRATVVTHREPKAIGPAMARLERVAEEHDVELVEEHAEDADIAVVLGGDGTMLRALNGFLGTAVPAIGVNFGRVGFLTSIQPDRLEADLARVFAGDYVVVELPTLETETEGQVFVAVNDIVATSSTLGRMVELQWNVGGEDLGRVPCDGAICATPSGSTAYNLSLGGPVLVRGLDAMAVTFAAPHSLHVRPLVVPRGLDLIAWNRTFDVGVTLLVDGHKAAEISTGGRVLVRLGAQRSLLATLPETTFFSRYRETFTH